MKFWSLFGISCIIAGAFIVQIFTVDTTNEVQEFKLIGKERFVPYETFQGLPEDICSNLTSLDLRFFQFDPNDLMQSLEGCTELKYIYLLAVEFLNPVTRNVRLAKLERFTLYNLPIRAKSAAELMAHLFFFNNEAEKIIPDTLKFIRLFSASGTDGMSLRYESGFAELRVSNLKFYDVTKYFNYRNLVVSNSYVDHNSLKVNNLTSLELYNAEYEDQGLFGALKSAYSLTDLRIRTLAKVNLPHRSIDLSIFPSIENFKYLSIENSEVLSSNRIHLRKLSLLDLNQCEFNSTLISVSVGELKFRRVRFVGENLTTFLSRVNKLEIVELDCIGIPGQKIDLTNGLENSSDMLISMVFSGIQLQISSKQVQFSYVISLSFIECAFDENPVSGFGVFPNLYNVVLYRNNLSYSLFQEILNSTVSKIDFIPRKSDVPEYKKFLQDSGVPSGLLGAELVKSKNSTTGWWVLGSYDDINLSNAGWVEFYFYILVLMAVCVFGLLGSVVSCIVLTRKNMWGSTSCILLGLTFCDSVVLLTYICSVLYFGIRFISGFLELLVPTDQDNHILGFEVTKVSIEKLDELQYSLLYPLNKTAYTGSVYSTVLLTIERYVAVCWPLHARQWLRTRFAVTSILIVLGFSLVLNFPRWIEAHQFNSFILFDNMGYNNQYLNGIHLNFMRNTQASGLLNHRYYRQFYHGWIWITFMYVLPISGLTVLNFLILKQLRKSNQNRKALAATTNQRSNTNQEELQLASLTKMLLCVIMIFVLCNTVSGCIVWVFTWYLYWDPMDTEILSCIPLIINSSINFVIYVLMGSKFRTELHNLISSWRNLICSSWNTRRSEQTENNVRAIPLVQFPSSSRPQLS